MRGLNLLSRAVDLLVAYSKQRDRVFELVSAVKRLRIRDAGEPVRVSVRSAEGTHVSSGSWIRPESFSSSQSRRDVILWR